jgi:hypothetical protein
VQRVYKCAARKIHLSLEEERENKREGDGNSWIPSPCGGRVRERGILPTGGEDE